MGQWTPAPLNLLFRACVRMTGVTCRAGCRDAVSQVPLPAGLLPSHVAVDGSCASAALDNGGFLTQPWLAASPFTGAPWKRARTDPYHGL